MASWVVHGWPTTRSMARRRQCSAYCFAPSSSNLGRSHIDINWTRCVDTHERPRQIQRPYQWPKALEIIGLHLFFDKARVAFSNAIEESLTRQLEWTRTKGLDKRQFETHHLRLRDPAPERRVDHDRTHHPDGVELQLDCGLTDLARPRQVLSTQSVEQQFFVMVLGDQRQREVPSETTSKRCLPAPRQPGDQNQHIPKPIRREPDTLL
jgi:hypothetical protein